VTDEKCILYFNRESEDHLEDLGVDEIIVINWIVKKWGRRVWIVFVSFMKWTLLGSFEHSYEPSGSSRV
jgi:hypothetical protein